MWNSLPNYIVEAPSIETFERSIGKFWSIQDIAYNYEVALSQSQQWRLGGGGFQAFIGLNCVANQHWTLERERECDWVCFGMKARSIIDTDLIPIGTKNRCSMGSSSIDSNRCVWFIFILVSYEIAKRFVWHVREVCNTGVFVEGFHNVFIQQEQIWYFISAEGLVFQPFHNSNFNEHGLWGYPTPLVYSTGYSVQRVVRWFIFTVRCTHGFGWNATYSGGRWF